MKGIKSIQLTSDYKALGETGIHYIRDVKEITVDSHLGSHVISEEELLEYIKIKVISRVKDKKKCPICNGESFDEVVDETKISNCIVCKGTCRI